MKFCLKMFSCFNVQIIEVEKLENIKFTINIYDII